MIGAAICLLCFALSFTYKNKIVNHLAGSILPAYLLQESGYWGYQWLYPFVYSLLSTQTLLSKYLILIVFAFFFLFMCVLFDLLIKQVLYHPVLGFYDQKIMPYERVIRDKLYNLLFHTA